MRRRELQLAYNSEHGITPRSVVKSTEQVRFSTRVADARGGRDGRGKRVAEATPTYASEMEAAALIPLLQEQMKQAAADLDFETAAQLRDQLFELQARVDGSQARRGGPLSSLKAPR